MLDETGLKRLFHYQMDSNVDYKFNFDCHDFKSTLKSWASLTGESPERITRWLSNSRELLSDDKKEAFGPERDDWLLKNFKKVFSIDMDRVNSVCWYHGTRIPKSGTFQGGLKPTGDIAFEVFKMLQGLVTDDIAEKDWRKFTESVKNSDYYSIRTKSNGAGPFAFLVRDAFFRVDEFAIHNYSLAPELVQLICEDFKAIKESVDLLKLYRKATQPAIIKFRSSPHVGSWAAASLLYLFYKTNGYALFCDDGNTCFNGEGLEIPETDILGIEIIKNQENLEIPQKTIILPEGAVPAFGLFGASLPAESGQ